MEWMSQTLLQAGTIQGRTGQINRGEWIRVYLEYIFRSLSRLGERDHSAKEVWQVIGSSNIRLLPPSDPTCSCSADHTSSIQEGCHGGRDS